MVPSTRTLWPARKATAGHGDEWLSAQHCTAMCATCDSLAQGQSATSVMANRSASASLADAEARFNAAPYLVQHAAMLVAQGLAIILYTFLLAESRWRAVLAALDPDAEHLLA